ncbi:MAG: ABC transporter ATP-binding protein [bacterium]|jgi:putative ABC transport system ATP-binding protein
MQNIQQGTFYLRDIHKTYRRGDEAVEIFEDMDMEIHQGDFLAVMGPSGSGKTTLLNLLGGLDKPDQGEIWYGRQRIDEMGQDALANWRALRLAFVFQSYNLLPMLSGVRNVELPLLLTSLSSVERKKRVATALDLVGLSAHAHRLPAQLSGGQQQRIAIARALVTDAAVLLCDEPTGNLDRKTSNEILEILALLNSEFHKTIVLVTHDIEAASYARQLCRLDKGRFAFERVAVPEEMAE